MANLPKYLDLIKVEYVKTSNGQMVRGDASLAQLLSDEMKGERENIVSLALLPLYNKDNSLFVGAKNPSDYIKDFPMLQTLAYPIQWEEISPKKMQTNNCPNLTTILRTTPEAQDGVGSTITVKGTPKVVLQSTPSDKDVETYGQLVGEGSDLYSIIKINPMSKIKAKSPAPKKKYITQDELLQRIAEMSDKLEAIERKVNQGNSNQITKTKITNILKSFVGRITTEQLDSIMDEIKRGIDVNISIESMEELNINIDKAITNSFNNIHAQIQGQENARYKQILLELATIKENTADDEQFKAKVLELLKGRLPDLIATNRILTDKVFMRLGQIEATLNKEGGVEDHLHNIDTKIADIDGFAELCMQELGVIHGLIGELSTSEEIKNVLKESFKELATTLTDQYRAGNNEFFEKVSQSIEKLPNEATIRKIAEEALNKSFASNSHMNKILANQITSTIINKMGELSRLDEVDLINVNNVINNFVNSTEFKAVISELINDENFATKEGLDALSNLMGEIALGHDLRMDQLSSQIEDSKDELTLHLEKIAFKLSGVMEGLDEGLAKLPTKSDIENLIRLGEDGEHLGLIPDAVRKIIAKSGLLTREDLSKMQASNVTREEFLGLVSQITELTKIVKENGGKVTNNYYTQQVPEITVPGVTNINVQQIMQNLQASLTNAVNMYVVNNAISQMYMQGIVGGVQPQIIGYQPVLALIAQAMQGQNLGIQPQINIDNSQMANILNLMIRNWGLMPSNNPEVDKLKAELENLKNKQQKDTDDLKKMLTDLMEEIKKLKTPEEKKEEKKDPKKPEPKKEEKPIETPKPVGKTKLVQGTVKHLARVQEPKLPLGKRIWKFIVRHPLRAAAIGLGVGALGVAGWALGASAIAAGSLSAGASALITNANFFLPSIAIGAGIGAGTMLGLGGIGAIVSRFSKKGRKERLYTKFLKQKAKCDEMAADIELKHEQQMEAQAKIQENREKQRHGNRVLKKLGVYKLAKKHHRKKFRKLRTKISDLENKRTAKVHETLSTKRKLNTMEQATGKSLAMGGYLDKLRKKKGEINNELRNPYLSDDDKEDLMEDLQDVLEDAEDEVTGITGLSDEYETFDTEAEELINSVKKPSPTMKDILTDIQAKNSKRTLHTQDAPVFDDNKVMEYLAKARASKNPQDQANADQVAKYMAELKANKTDIDTLINEGKISRHLANQLRTRGVVEVPSTERVDVEFKEDSNDMTNN